MVRLVCLFGIRAVFPKGNSTAQLMSVAAVFAVGFLMRPIGAWVMGIYADRHGRKSGLTLSVTLMCAGSFLIAITPGFATIGWIAPALLILARLMQGLSVGGEYGASAVYLSEMAGKSRRGFFSSFQYVTLIAGQLLALGVLLLLQSTLDTAQLDAWGWRIPHPSRAARDRKLSERQGRRHAEIERLAAVQQISARSVHRAAADRRRYARLLCVHHVHAEVPGQYEWVQP
jgi:MFS family permease